MIYSLREFLETIIVEELHPELAQIVRSGQSHVNKKTLIAKKIKELTKRGEDPGIAGTPAGSSRVFLEHKEPEHIIVDGQHTQIKTGTKAVIRAPLDKTHDKKEHGGRSLGQLQMEAENGDGFVNNQYRVLAQDRSNPHHYETNENGIFPPLIDHDWDNHEWSHIGHAEPLKDMQRHTKTADFPHGIGHAEFCNALEREWDLDHGKRHIPTSPDDKAREDNLAKISQHPLVQKFLDHQKNLGFPPHDYRQKANLGIWKHPATGQHHVVARDHGFSQEVMMAYKKARQKAWKR